MSGASDKARFYLEQSVPELHELERKEIFTKPEITSIVNRRSDFEHTLAARGSHIADYVRYASYEMNLDLLRRKRVKRLGVKSTTHTGQRRIFFILERATQKFHGDMGLWMLYLDYARKQKSWNKVAEILTRMLRLHPTKAELWIYAARCAVEERGDVAEARSFLQRGLRFCEGDEGLWLEYGRLECGFIAKIEGRRRVLGLDKAEETKEMAMSEDISGDLVALPSISTDDLNPERRLAKVDAGALEKFDDNLVLSGALPIAVFDAAIKRFRSDQKLAVDFFDMVAEFSKLRCRHIILNHIMDTLRSGSTKTPGMMVRYIRLPVIGLEVSSPEFPPGLGKALSRVKGAQDEVGGLDAKLELDFLVMRWVLPFLDDPVLDDDLRQVLELTLTKMWGQYQSDVESSHSGKGKSAQTIAFLSEIEARGLKQIAGSGRSWAEHLWPEECSGSQQVAPQRESKTSF